MSERHCPDCQIGFDGALDDACPLCGGPVRSAGDQDDSELAATEVRAELPFTLYGCEATGCGTTYVLDKSQRCPSCGEPDPGDDPRWVEREAAFGAVFQAVLNETDWWREHPLVFSERGPRKHAGEHLSWLTDRMAQQAMELLETAKLSLTVGDWSMVESPATRDAFERLIGVCRGYGGLIRTLLETAPPLSLLAAHRQMTRAIAILGGAVVGFAGVLTARYAGEARGRMEQAQNRLDAAADRISRFSWHVRRAEQLEESPGFWVVGEDYDTGRVAWEGVDQRISSILDAAQLVRSSFESVPGIADLADEQAVMLLPAAAIGAGLQDWDRLTERAAAARRVLDEADRLAPDWMADGPGRLVDRVWRGHRQLIDQVVLLGYAFRADMPRRPLLQLALDVFSKFYEGPLELLGGVVAIASGAASEGTRFDAATVERYGPKATSRALEEHHPVLLQGISLRLRHAGSHYDFEIADDHVLVRHLIGEEVERFSDEDLLEQILNLNEALIAIELAVLPWLWSRPEPAIQEDLEARSRAPEAARETIRAIAGLKGWTDLDFHREGDVLRLGGVYRGSSPEEAAQDLLPIVAAVWDAFEGLRLVDVGPALGSPLELHVDDFADTTVSSMIGLHRIAFLMARVEDAAGRWSNPDVDLRLRLLPGATLPAQAAHQLLVDPDRSRALELVNYLKWLDTRLATGSASGRTSLLRAELRDTLRRLRLGVNTWLTAANRPASRLEERARQQVAAQALRLTELADTYRQPDARHDPS